MPDSGERDSSLPKIPKILGIWILILSFVNTLANSFRVKEPRLGENATGVSAITTEPLCPSCQILKAEALYLADRTSEALEAIREAEAVAERSEGRWWCAEMHRLRGVFLTAIGADEVQIEASFCAAIKTAREQNPVSLAKRAEATYAENRRQKASALGGHGFRLPLC